MQFSKFFVLFNKFIRVNFLLSGVINFRHFGIKGLLKMPIIIEYGSKFRCSSKNSITFSKPLQRGMLLINQGNKIIVSKGGKIILNGTRACFNHDNSVLVYADGVLEIGNNFFANGESEFNCKKGLKFGDDVLISVHVMLLDTDYHPIYNLKGERINYDKEIVIGNNVWLGCNVTILKGTVIANNIIIGANSLVSGILSTENSIYAGNPVKIIQNGITWHP